MDPFYTSESIDEELDSFDDTQFNSSSPPRQTTTTTTLDDDEDDEDFQQRVSGFGSMTDDPQPPLDLEEEEVQREEEEEEEEDEDQLDDAQRENHAMTIYAETHPELSQRYVGGREIAEQEAIWSVSSFRPHWGPDKLRDNNALTYWQSDCPNPRKHHTIDLSFHQATLIRQVSLFIDFFQDESYTPKTISIRGGTTYRDLYEIMTLECDEMVGWINADITSRNDGNPFRVFRLQIAILTTHLNGRDTHIRQLKVYSVLPSYFQGNHVDDGEREAETVTISRKPINRGLR